MLVLDENLPAGQRSLLRKWRIRFRVVGAEIAASGTLDPNLIPILHQSRRRRGRRRRTGVAPVSSFIPLAHQEVTVYSHQNRSGEAVPDDVSNRRDAGPTA
jgi:hypothetical protein